MLDGWENDKYHIMYGFIMFNLLQKLNEELKESIERRTPVIKVTMTDAPTTTVIKPKTTVIDVQYLTSKNVIMESIRLIKQILSQFKTSFDFNFETKEDGLFSSLILTAESNNNPKKFLQFEFSQLTDSDISGIKKNISLIS